MAWRIADNLIAGYFDNRHRNSSHGHLMLAGMEAPIIFELTGDPDPSLVGRTFEFRAKDPEKAKPMEQELALYQIGATGSMTLRMAKVPRIPIEEWDHKSPLECDWELCLYLEWFSQNGRVVIELVDPVILLRGGEDIEVPEIPEEGVGGFSFTVVERKGSEDDEDDPEYEAKSYSLFEEEDEDDDPERDAALGFEEFEDSILEVDEEKYLESQLEGEILGSLLMPQQLPHVHEVDEETAGPLVKSLLTELALHGVAVHLCEHCDMREAYRYLVEHILREGRADPELKHHGWITNFDYGEHCEYCKAIYEQLSVEDPERDNGDPESDEDKPF